MADKYMSIEAAAARLSLQVDEVSELRRKGDLRGFADRGTWKFRVEDIEEFARQRQADSDPEFPLLDDDFAGPMSDGEAPISLGGESGSFISFDDLEERTFRPPSLQSSDSDVRLINDGSSLSSFGLSNLSFSDDDDDRTENLVGDSDSDVKLADNVSKPAAPKPPSLGGDTKLAQLGADSDSDSDVQLAPKGRDSDSDVQLIPSSSGLSLGGDSGISLAPAEDNLRVLDADSGGSGLSGLSATGMLVPDSGISLGSDSGISLELAADSGISLGGDDDDSITLDLTDSDVKLTPDSGVTLADAPIKPGKGAKSPAPAKPAAPAKGRSIDKTMDMPALADDDEPDTNFELDPIDGGSDGDSAYDLSADPSDDATNVIMFEEDEDADQAATAMLNVDDDDDSSVFDLDAAGGEEFDEADLDLDEDVAGEDDALEDLDVFDPVDEDEGFESGESQAEFVPSAARGGYAPVAPPWTTGVFVGMMLSTLVMLGCSLVMFELVHSMWAYSEPFAPSNLLLDSVAGFFKT